jgi:hypothetical protein
MERESFESKETAELMNKHFVNIKVATHVLLPGGGSCFGVRTCACQTPTGCSQVDREERPDVDRVYMTFVQAGSLISMIHRDLQSTSV